MSEDGSGEVFLYVYRVDFRDFSAPLMDRRFYKLAGSDSVKTPVAMLEKLRKSAEGTHTKILLRSLFTLMRATSKTD